MPSCGRSLHNLVLVGFMGAGKSTVGRLLSDALGMPFCDTDTLIVERVGMSIPQIFAEQGEPYFRRVEAEVVQEVARESGRVIATGGGALADPETLSVLLRDNLVVWLAAPLEVLLARARSEGNRPLLVEVSQDRVRRLYESRMPQYAQAHLVVRADDSPERLAKIIQGHWKFKRRGEAAARQVKIDAGHDGYTVHVGSNLLECFPELVPCLPGQGLLITDSNVAPLYAERAMAALRRGGCHVRQVVIPAGEEFKNLQTLESLYEACVSAGLSRDGLIVALGGGVTGDIAGLTAATYMRGIPWLQIPTTLLAQVDASVGGKVAVNLKQGKNLVGAFYQPRAVIADTDVLCSLPERELLSGLAEVIKHGVMAEEDLFRFVEEHLQDILNRDPNALGHCVYRSCVIKGAVVESDEKETGLREILNFGHTVAHALESVTGYTEYTHGEAVAIGMVTAGRLSHMVGGWSGADVERLIALLRRAGLPISAPHVSIDELLQAVEHDKKVRAGQIRMVLSQRFGSAPTGSAVSRSQLREALEWQRGL
ncbi:MAG: 3-dehydroquinate synthase [Firmicutes bacterium]|nr:3-dehydroquinate synthase [Bacillota bacterium]